MSDAGDRSIELLTAGLSGDDDLLEELIAAIPPDELHVAVCGLVGFVSGMLQARVAEAAAELGFDPPPAPLDVWRDYLARSAGRRDAG